MLVGGNILLMLWSSSRSKTSDSQSEDRGFESHPEYMNDSWKKSSRCGTSTCVEVKVEGDFVLVRDNDRDCVSYSLAEWRVFIEGVKLGEFDV
jgi:hypothetical protein